MRTILVTIVAVIAAGALGWYAGRKRAEQGRPPQTGEKKVAFYQSSMHPWIKSEKPGNCTICGMKLTPIYEGEKGFEAEGELVTLSSNGIQVINVQSEPVKVRQLKRELHVAGRIEADETRLRVLSAYLDGRIEKLFVNYLGAEVRAGEPLAVLYSPEVLSAEREYLNIISRTNHADSPRLAAEHQRLVEGAYNRLKRLGLTDPDIEGLLSKGATNLTTRIRAPISGTVVTRSVYEGQYVKEGDKLFEIADLSKVWFKFDIYEQDLSWIARGLPVEVTSMALGTNVFTGQISFIDPNINDAARSARVRVELENPLLGEGERARRLLYNGLYAEGRIKINAGEGLAVPRTAVIDPGDFPRVYIDSGGGAYELRRVKIGRRGEDYWEVLEGVDEDELVVTSGTLLLDSQAQMNQGVSSASEPAVEDGKHGHEAHP